MLADFSFTPPEEIYANLRKSGLDGRHGRPTKAGGKMIDVEHESRMPSPPAPDLNDVKYDAFLANFRTLADPEVVKVEPGGTGPPAGSSTARR